MSPTLMQTRASFSVLDRLIDIDPDSAVEAPGRLSTARDLQDAVWRNLDALLNTKRKVDPIPSEFDQCNRSLLVFGLPDFTALSLKSPTDQEKLGRAIEAAIRM